MSAPQEEPEKGLDEHESARSGGGWKISWGRIAAFLSNVYQLERSVETLKSQKKQLESDLNRLQREVDVQAGQLRTIMFMIDSTLNERAAQSGERAAARFLRQMMAFKDEPSEDQS